MYKTIAAKKLKNLSPSLFLISSLLFLRKTLRETHDAAYLFVLGSPVLIPQCSQVLGAVLHLPDNNCSYTEKDADFWSTLERA